jgi:hypothetical protein
MDYWKLAAALACAACLYWLWRTAKCGLNSSAQRWLLAAWTGAALLQAGSALGLEGGPHSVISILFVLGICWATRGRMCLVRGRES